MRGLAVVTPGVGLDLGVLALAFPRALLGTIGATPTLFSSSLNAAKKFMPCIHRVGKGASAGWKNLESPTFCGPLPRNDGTYPNALSTLPQPRAKVRGELRLIPSSIHFSVPKTRPWGYQQPPTRRFPRRALPPRPLYGLLLLPVPPPFPHAPPPLALLRSRSGGLS